MQSYGPEKRAKKLFMSTNNVCLYLRLQPALHNGQTEHKQEYLRDTSKYATHKSDDNKTLC